MAMRQDTSCCLWFCLDGAPVSRCLWKGNHWMQMILRDKLNTWYSLEFKVLFLRHRVVLCCWVVTNVNEKLNKCQSEVICISKKEWPKESDRLLYHGHDLNPQRWTYHFTSPTGSNEQSNVESQQRIGENSQNLLCYGAIQLTRIGKQLIIPYPHWENVFSIHRIVIIHRSAVQTHVNNSRQWWKKKEHHHHHLRIE